MTDVSPTRVLVADDDPAMLLLMRTLFDLLPEAEVVGEAEDGDEALRLVSETDPDVALLDIEMPLLDGLTAAEVIRSRWPSVRVVLHTGAYQGNRVRALAHALGIPVFDKTTVATTIENALLAGRARQSASDGDSRGDDKIDALVRMAVTGRSNQALVIVSAGGAVVFYNSAAADLLDLPVPAQPVELVKVWASTGAVWPDGRPRLPHERPLGIALATHSPAEDDVIQVAADGTQRHLFVTAVPFFADGEMIGVGDYISEIRHEPARPTPCAARRRPTLLHQRQRMTETHQTMPLYEYVLRRPGHADETLVSEHDTVATGDTLTVRNRVWIVTAVESSPDANVAERKILTPHDDPHRLDGRGRADQ